MNETPNSNLNADLSHSDTPLTTEEKKRYSELLTAAYPSPKSVKDNVMARIHAERKAARLRRIVRYGSIAASFVLIMGVVISIAPILNGTRKSAEAEDIVTYALTSDRSIHDVSHTAGKADNGAMAECDVLAPTAADPTDEDCSEAIAQSYAESPEYVTADSAVITLHCSEHQSGMHTFPAILIDHIGADAFNRWYNSPAAIDDCGIPSLRNLVLAFGITADQLKEIGASAGIDFPMAEIYGTN